MNQIINNNDIENIQQEEIFFGDEEGIPPFRIRVEGTDDPEFTMSPIDMILEGDLELLKKLTERHNLRFVEEDTEFAAEENQFEILQYLISIGTPYSNIWCLGKAIKFGNVETFKWLYDLSIERSLQSIWTVGYRVPSRFLEQIDLDDVWWRNALFNQDLRQYPVLQKMVEEKKKEIEYKKEKSMEVLNGDIVKEVIMFNIHTYF